jgi:terminase small subunit-like protein
MPKTPGRPTFSIVSPETTGAPPPRDLGQHGRELWNAVQREYGISDRGGIELLAQCCAAADTAEALAAAIARDGAVIYSRTGVPRSHPAVKDALACRAFIVKTIERLGLNVEGVKPVGRPTANIGWTGEA